MSVSNKGLPAESSSGLKIPGPIIPIALMILVLIRMPSVCNTESEKALAPYDPNSVAQGRQDCIGDTCCSPPYKTVRNKLWNYAKSDYSCCTPKAPRQDRIHCCPHPLIPSKEPNMDPAFGPFCCDPVTGHCCTKLYTRLGTQTNPEFIYSEPIGGGCCPVHDRMLRECCPRPLSMAFGPAYNLDWRMTNPNIRSPLCCSTGVLCFKIQYYYDDVPTPRLCSPRKFCCPWPYAPKIQLIRYPNGAVLKKDDAPQFDPQNDNQCVAPTGRNCTLPQVPWFRDCIEQQFATEVSRQDTPLYDMIPREFSNVDPSTTAASATAQCLKSDVFRRAYGNPFGNPGSSSVPIDWFVTSPYVQRSKLLNETFVREKIWTWPDVIVPFIFPITIVTVSLATVIPALLLGAICWAVVFNFRFFWTKKVRMAIRGILVCLEKRRRIIQDRYLPPEDQRKFHVRDRYQLPKSLQDSDRSDDDEPEDLKRTHDNLTESNWTAEEINALGFDPDNIPVDWIYGDLLGNPSALRKEVKAYNENAAKASGRPILAEDDEIMKQLDFEEWLHFLTKGQTGNQDDMAPQGAKLVKKIKIHRYKVHKKKVASKRAKVRLETKPSMAIHTKPSTTTVTHEKKSIRKAKSKKKRKHQKIAQ